MSLPPPPSVPSDREGLLAAVESALSAVAQLTATISEEQTLLPTPCAGWTVRDQVAHVTGLESRFLGRPGPDSHELPPLAHVTNDIQRFMEVDVDARRAQPWPDVQAEAAEVIAARIEQLRGYSFDPNATVETPFGPRPVAAALSLRAFDAWAHEQDLRDALGRPGGMDTPAAAVSIARAAAALGQIGANAGLSESEAVRIEVPEGPFAFAASSNPSVTPGATLRMDAGTFTRLCCGRSSADKASVVVTGDAELGRRFLDAMAITP